MTQSSVSAWCETLQSKLMAALEAAWATIEATADPAALRQARDKAKAIGELATMARKVAAMAGLPRAKAAGVVMAAADPAPAVKTQAEHALRALEQLKANRRR